MIGIVDMRRNAVDRSYSSCGSRSATYSKVVRIGIELAREEAILHLLSERLQYRQDDQLQLYFPSSHGVLVIRIESLTMLLFNFTGMGQTQSSQIDKSAFAGGRGPRKPNGAS